MITLCYGPLFLGMKFVASGTAAVLEMSLMPLALLAFGITMGEERWSHSGLRSRDHGLGHEFRDLVRPTRFGLGSDLVSVGVGHRT
jgi:hypothetical protein